jgi:hypothetical protein
MRRLLTALSATLALLAGVALLSAPAQADAMGMVVHADGAQVLPGPGDTNASGDAMLNVDPVSNRFCYEITGQNLGHVTSSRIELADRFKGTDRVVGVTKDHRFVEGKLDPVIELDPAKFDGGGQTCLTIDAAIATDLAKSFSDYEWTTGTSDFPRGAMRGAVKLAGFTPLQANGNGAQVVPGPGDPDATLTVSIQSDNGHVDSGELCYEITATMVALPVTAIELHRGAPGQTGDLVVTLRDQEGGDAAVPEMNGAQVCQMPDPALLTELTEHPERFYIQVDTDAFPNGAVRAQVRDPGDAPAATPSPSPAAPATTTPPVTKKAGAAPVKPKSVKSQSIAANDTKDSGGLGAPVIAGLAIAVALGAGLAVVLGLKRRQA